MFIVCLIDLRWCVIFIFFFFKQKTAYEMRISDWSSDVCSSDLPLCCGYIRQSDCLPRACMNMQANCQKICARGSSMTAINPDFLEINRGKADFSAIYVQPDPRAYFRTLGALGYVIPHLARPVFDQLIEARQRARGGQIGRAHV